jgi:hypothetical protein
MSNRSTSREAVQLKRILRKLLPKNGQFILNFNK